MVSIYSKAIVISNNKIRRLYMYTDLLLMLSSSTKKMEVVNASVSLRSHSSTAPNSIL